MKNQVLTDLKSLQKLFANKKRWTQHTYARNAKGNAVPPLSTKAVRWCITGGCYKITRVTPAILPSNDPRHDNLYKSLQNVSSKCPTLINDHLGIDSVRRMIADAIKRVETK